MYGGDLPAQSVKLIAWQNPQNRNIKFIWPSEISQIEARNPTLVLFMDNSMSDLEVLKTKYPQGVMAKDLANGAWVYYIRPN